MKQGKYFGQKKFESQFPGLYLSEYDYLAPDTIWHYHEHPYFMYVLNGEMTDINKKGKSLIPTGSLVFHNWQEQHKNEKKSKTGRGFHLELNRDWFEGKKLNIDLWEGSQVIERPNLHHLLGKIYYEFRAMDTFSEMAIELLVMQLSEGLDSSSEKEIRKEPSWIKPLKDLLHDSTEKLSLKYLSDQLNIHPVHLSRSIPKYLDCNLGEYLRRQKVKKAFGQLLNPKVSLTDIAYGNGFSDQSHFTKIFKSYFGMTPSLFRSQVNK